MRHHPRRFDPADLSREEKADAVTALAEGVWDACAAFVNATKTDASRPVPSWAELGEEYRHLFAINASAPGIAAAEMGILGAMAGLVGRIVAQSEQDQN
jgi:hypothetical protein